MEKRFVYVDNAATTPISKEVLDAMMPWLTEGFGNASSIYSKGREAGWALHIVFANFTVVDFFPGTTLLGCTSIQPTLAIFYQRSSELRFLEEEVDGRIANRFNQICRWCANSATNLHNQVIFQRSFQFQEISYSRFIKLPLYSFSSYFSARLLALLLALRFQLLVVGV